MKPFLSSTMFLQVEQSTTSASFAAKTKTKVRFPFFKKVLYALLPESPEGNSEKMHRTNLCEILTEIGQNFGRFYSQKKDEAVF